MVGGPHWPEGGEIDVIEGVHNDKRTTHNLHTANTCDYSHVDRNALTTGHWGSGKKNCWAKAPNQVNNVGCGVNAAEGTHGKPWTDGKGGVTVLLWSRSVGIKIWDLPRSKVPSTLKKTTTSISDSDLKALGKPTVFFPFGNGCTADSFHQQTV